MILLFWYVVVSTVIGSAVTYYKLSHTREKGSVIGGFIGHTFKVIAYAAFLINVYPLLQ